MMKKIVVFTGAGISAESGLKTFRDADGLWAEYRIEDVCTPEALARNRALVIEFYNKRRRELATTTPNAAHQAVAALEQWFDVEVVTQNVDEQLVTSTTWIPFKTVVCTHYFLYIAFLYQCFKSR